ncbi:hypothetical protein O1611_g4143 [Lasiodiplodia mahajangana]|uniref:Uncharacterized protein n=1 Tax=Lasiodiplodia mahajangana TaxID=1108764 RepID=A0ACC2JQL9_9PEZI|nr:hypothetical protein O1611_g4143 [Lasiodiplodia mahajangana]
MRLAEYFDGDIPHYAILSHTWGPSDEEVTFQDILHGRGKRKSGYGKIRFCAEQAARDGLEFFWVDSCCIDKSSSAELSEAINSMFNWYYNAAKCYAYLSDVSVSTVTGNDLFSQRARKYAFQRSRWFTRSWTLQELLAPPSVEFFARSWERVGDRITLREDIHHATKIPIRAFEGTPLSQFTVNERMSWAARREAKREEDTAYSLLGIFNVHMPVLYGEGRESAFGRLRKEIDQSTEQVKLRSFLLHRCRCDL